MQGKTQAMQHDRENGHSHFLHYWAICEENPAVTSGFPSQRAGDM